MCYPNAAGFVSGTQMKHLLLVAAFGLLVVACGATGVGSGSNPSPTPSQGTGVGFDVTATEQDHAVSMRVGQKLEVILHTAGGVGFWNQPQSSDTKTLQPIVDTGATAVRGVTLAAFRATSAGQVKVTAVGGPLCSPGQPCPMYAVLYSLTVTVTP
jgi:hypothetical protein